MQPGMQQEQTNGGNSSKHTAVQSRQQGSFLPSECLVCLLFVQIWVRASNKTTREKEEDGVNEL